MRLTCFSSPRVVIFEIYLFIFVVPDGSWEDGAGHRGGVRVQAGVAPPGGGALFPQIPLDRGAGALDPRAAVRRHQSGGKQEPHHVGHCTHTSINLLWLSKHLSRGTNQADNN